MIQFSVQMCLVLIISLEKQYNQYLAHTPVLVKTTIVLFLKLQNFPSQFRIEMGNSLFEA